MKREMKHSGVAWIGEIPEHWEIERGKNVLVLQKRPVREKDEVITCFRDGEVILRSLRRTEGFTMSDKEIGYQGINEGDIVIHGMDGFAGAMGVSKSTGKGSPVLVVCTPKYDAIPEYIIYYLRSLAITDVFVALATGIRERSCDLRWNKVSELEFILPTAKEQQKIAEFLDRKCGEIDEMISLQEKVIEELKAYKQSIITEAVTKGLNPNVAMKDSGIEWIGEIPEHWSKDKIIRSFRMIGSGTTPKSTDENNFDGDINWIQSGDINGGVMASCKNRVSNETIENCSALKVYSAPFIIVAMYGASVGNTSISSIDGCVNQACCVLSDSALNFNYAFSVIKSCKDYWLRKAVGGGQPNISQETIKETWIPIPPITEQQAIADYLDEKCADIDSLIQTKQSKIDSLKEYKKSIIYEYVTGKKEIL